jgi:hypothetical protein
MIFNTDIEIALRNEYASLIAAVLDSTDLAEHMHEACLT